MTGDTLPAVAVTGLHRGESPQPGGAVAESLRIRFPALRIIGLCYDPMESGIYSTGADRLDAARLMPFPGTGTGALMQRLGGIVAQDGIGAIIPCLDSELQNYAAVADELATQGVRMILPEPAALQRRDKAQLAVLCRTLGIATPRTAEASDPVTLAGHAARIGYPCYVKGRLYDARRVTTLAELHAAFHDIFAVWGGPVLVQEAVEGEEYDIAGIGDGKGGLEAFCTIRKLLRSRLGKGFAGVVLDNPGLERIGRRIVAELRWDGPFELEFIRPPGGEPLLMEMNPRFPAWISFPAKIGCNMPAAMLERLLALPRTPLPRCEAGKMFFRHCADIVGDVATLAMLSADQADGAAP